MSILDGLKKKAAAHPVRVVFPEAENEKMMQASYECAKDRCIRPILVGEREKLSRLAEERGYDPEVFLYADNHDESLRDELVQKFTALPDTLLKEKALRRRMEDPLYFAMIMQKAGEADVTFAGIDYTTEDVLLAGQMIIGLKAGISTVSSIGLCEIPGFNGSEGELLAVGDSAVCADPTEEQLADIAVSSCETVKALLGWEPRCALISYSTDGSGQGPLVDKVRNAVKRAKEKRPDLKIDGEFQLDAAIVPEVGQKKVKRESDVAGKANVLIWPDLNAGNAGVKLIQIFGRANAYGPLLQGFDKIICDCSRSAPVDELKGNIIMSAIRAAGRE